MIFFTSLVFLEGLAIGLGETSQPPGMFGAAVGRIYNLLYPIAITYGTFQIIIAGYRIMISEGEPKKLSEAKEHLTDSIVGIIFVILGIVILRVIIKSFLYQDVSI